MKRVSKIVINLFNRIEDIFARLTMTILVLLMLSVTYSVVIRYIFNAKVFGMFDVWEYTMLFLPFLGAAWLLREEGHIRMDVVTARLKPRAQTILNIITAILSTFTTLVLTWFGTIITIKIYQKGITHFYRELWTPEWIILAIIPIGGLLLFLESIRRTYLYMGKRRKIETLSLEEETAE